MSVFNASDFNQNVECQGVGVTDEVRDPYKTSQLAVSSLAAAFIVITSIFFLWRRSNRRRLRLRSPTPLIFGSFLSTALVMVRSYYNYVGKQYFACTFSLALYYLIIPCMIVADTLAFVRYVHSMSARQDVSGDTLRAVAQAKKTTTEHLGTASLRIWMIEEKFRRVSLRRLATYECFTMMLLLLPFIVASISRSRSVPSLRIENGCTGCGVLLEDWIIVFFLFLLYIVPFANFAIRNRDLPDSLSFKKDAIVAGVFVATFVLTGSVLVLVDPGRIMQSQRFDWFTFEIMSVLFFHCQRCVVQLYRTARIHRFTEQNISLIEVLSDGKGSLLFEKHLISELANENLLFWREAIKYKLSYDKQQDFDYTQQMARVLYRTFIGKHAQLPINISDSLARSIEQRFRGTVGRMVFDEAIIEVYKLLEGPFRRFIRSEAFKDYVSTKADFSVSMLNPLAIVPHSTMHDKGKENYGLYGRFDIEDYVRSL